MPTSSKVILVTGATGGIGQPLCRRLADRGHSLVLAARDAGRLEELAQSLPGGEGQVHSPIVVDMTDDVSIADFGGTLTDREIRLDGVVLMPPQTPRTNDSMPDSPVWRSLFQNSFIGPLALLKVAIGTMRPDPARGRRGKVVIVSAISSAQVMSNYATSNVLRTAWLAEAKTMAFALGGQGIHVNTLSLGGTLTPDYAASIHERAAKAGVSFEARVAEETANVPLGKYGAPEEVAGAVEALLSDFSDHLTGVNIMHDGGFTRAY